MRAESRQSESIIELTKALIKARASMGKVVRSRTAEVRSAKGNYTYSYADLETVLCSVTNALGENGLAIFQSTHLLGGNDLILLTRLAHESGQWVESECLVRPTLPTPQGEGSGLTYVRRYQIQLVCGIAPEDDDATDTSRPPDRAREDGEVSSGPRLGNPTTKTRNRWARWLEKLLDRWNEAEEAASESEWQSRENRIAQALITEAGPEFERLCYKPAEAGKASVRDPRKVWDTVHRLAAGDWGWTKEATLKHLRKHVKAAPTSVEPDDVLRGA